jgi:hypothetical protein
MLMYTWIYIQYDLMLLFIESSGPMPKHILVKEILWIIVCIYRFLP